MPHQRKVHAILPVAAAFAVGVSTAGCAAGVPQAQYDLAAAELNKEKGRNAELEKQNAELRSKATAPPPTTASPDADLQAELEELKKQKAAAEARAKTVD